MNKKQMSKQFEKQKVKLANQARKWEKQAAAEGFKFNTQQLAKSADDAIKGLTKDGLNKYRAEKPKIDSQVAAKGLELSQRANKRAYQLYQADQKVQAFRSAHGGKKFEDLRNENQALIQGKINNIQDTNARTFVDSVFGSVAKGLNTQFMKFVPKGLTYEGAVKMAGSSLLSMVKGLPAVEAQKAKWEGDFKKLESAVNFKCARFNGGKAACKRAIKDVENYANNMSSKVGADKVLAWAQQQKAKFQVKSLLPLL